MSNVSNRQSHTDASPRPGSRSCVLAREPGANTPRAPRVPAGRAANGRTVSWLAAVVTSAALAFVVVPVAGMARPLVTAEAADGAAGQADIVFVVHGVGVATRDTAIADRPIDGAAVYLLPAGVPVDVGGALRARDGLRMHTVLWVRVTDDQGTRYGFAEVDGIALTGGTAPRLAATAEAYPDMLSPRDEGTDLGALAARPDDLGVGPGDGDHRAGPGAGEDGSGPGAGEDGSGPGAGTLEASAVRSIGTVAIPWLPDTVARWVPDIVDAAGRRGVDPELLAIITLVESGGGPDAGSSAGARGLTQVMPATGAGIAAQLGIASFTADDLWRPAVALDFGAFYLAQQLASFGRADDPDWQRSVELAAAAYNGGPGTVRSGRLPAETERYQRWVGGMWRERHEATSATYESWLAAGGRFLIDAARRSAEAGG